MQAKLEELENDYNDEYQFRVHEENGMEGHEDFYLKNLRSKIDKIKEELKNREAAREEDDEYNFRVHQQNGMENNEDTQEPVEQQPPVSTKNPYNKVLSEYGDIFDMYDQDLETLYNLQKQYENGEIPYSEYEKHADYMVERYRYIMKEYEKINGMYEKSKPNPFEKLTDEQLQAKLEELENDFNEEYQFRAHEENGMEEHEDYYLKNLQDKISKIKAELNNRKENPYRNLSNEELQAKLEELENDFNEEYQFRAHEENGMEEHEDDFIKDYEDKKKKIQEELDRRNNKDMEKPRKPEQPMMIKDKENPTSEPVPEPEPEPIPVSPVPPVPTPVPEPNKLPIRSFWEIYNSTNTEHAGSIATTLYNMAHMKILPHKDEDTMTKILSGVTIPFKALAKVVALAPNAILGTNAKMDEMRENIANLSPEEFDTLVMRSADIKEKYDGANIKAEYDTDYLDPQFMKQYKVNNLYLQAVSERLHADRGAEIERCNQEVENCNAQIEYLNAQKKSRPLTLAERVLYSSAISSREEYKRQGKDLVNEMKDFDRGAKEKSSSFKNIRGWFLAKFNPDNRDENAKMAELSKQRRLAAESGDRNTVYEMSDLMTQFSEAQTELKGKGKNGIDVGKYSIESAIEMLDRGEDTRGRLLLTNAATIATVVNLVNQFQQAAQIEQQVNQHNADINQHNSDITQHNADITQHNADITQRNADIADLKTTISSDQQTLSDYANDVAQHNADITAANTANSSISYSGQVQIPGMEEAQEAYARLGLEGHFNSMERNTLDAANWNVNSPLYKQLDAITHTSGESAATAINSALQQKDYAGALDILYQYQSKYPINSSVTQTYMVNNPQFDYTPIDLNAPADYTTMHDFLTQGDVQYRGTVAGTMVDQIKDVPEMQIFTKTLDDIKNIEPLKGVNGLNGINGLNIDTNINWLPAIMASANALYQGAKQGFRDGIKVAREKIAQKRNGTVSNENNVTKKEDERV